MRVPSTYFAFLTAWSRTFTASWRLMVGGTWLV